MFDELQLTEAGGTRPEQPEAHGGGSAPAAAVVPEQAPPQRPNGDGVNPDARSRRVEAGRKGGRRAHELLERGLLYEREHGLKRGRQRVRQLIQQGRLYEQEHGLAPAGRRSAGKARVSGEQALVGLLQYVHRLAQPRFRPRIAQLIDALVVERN
jgi:hypothetical protein